MKNKENAVKKPRLGYLDLSFEGFKQGNVDNGRRPHGGYRGTKKHPPTALTLDNKEYQRRLGEDLAKLISVTHPTPGWALEVNKGISHSGESPLFINKFLSPTKVENQNARFRCAAEPRNTASMTGDGALFYRPNRTHQFLTMTEVKDYAQSEVDLRYGRPTRTTLLRARQRTSSAPVNAYNLRREMMKKIEEMKNSCSSLRSKLLHNFEETEDGESEHYFLTGARYNRAHYYDAKILENYGVYMPRDNPKACFVTGAARLKDGWDLPSAPPDSPVSDVDEMSSPVRSQRPKTAPGYGRRTTTFERPHQAWVEKAETDVREQVVYLPNGIRVQGSRMPLKRTYSPQPRYEDSTLPSVHGVSVSRKQKGREIADDDLSVNQPPPSLQFLSSKEDISIYKGSEFIETKKEEKPRKPKPVLVDRSVNVPSVTSESGRWKDEPYMMVSGIGPQLRIVPPTPLPSKSEVNPDTDVVEQTSSGKVGATGDHVVLSLGELDVDMKVDGGETAEEMAGKAEEMAGNVEKLAGNVEEVKGNVQYVSVGNDDVRNVKDVVAGSVDDETGNVKETAGNVEKIAGNVDDRSEKERETTGDVPEIKSSDNAGESGEQRETTRNETEMPATETNNDKNQRSYGDVEGVDENRESGDSIATGGQIGRSDESKTSDKNVENTDSSLEHCDEQNPDQVVETVEEKQTSGGDDRENGDQSQAIDNELDLVKDLQESVDDIIVENSVNREINTAEDKQEKRNEVEIADKSQRIKDTESLDKMENADIRESEEITAEGEVAGDVSIDGTEVERDDQNEIVDVRNSDEQREEPFDEVETVERDQGIVDETETVDGVEEIDEQEDIDKGFAGKEVQFTEGESARETIDSPTADGEESLSIFDDSVQETVESMTSESKGNQAVASASKESQVMTSASKENQAVTSASIESQNLRSASRESQSTQSQQSAVADKKPKWEVFFITEEGGGSQSETNAQGASFKDGSPPV